MRLDTLPFRAETRGELDTSNILVAGEREVYVLRSTESGDGCYVYDIYLDRIGDETMIPEQSWLLLDPLTAQAVLYHLTSEGPPETHERSESAEAAVANPQVYEATTPCTNQTNERS